MRAYKRAIAAHGDALVFATGGDKGGDGCVIYDADGGRRIMSKNFFINKLGDLDAFSAGRNFGAEKVLKRLKSGYAQYEKRA